MTCAAGGFGSGGFGSGGSGSGGGVAVSSAKQIARNAVQVTFDGVPAASDPATYWDALNPANWTLTVREPADAVARSRLRASAWAEASAAFFSNISLTIR